jgi:hypothetical protein
MGFKQRNVLADLKCISGRTAVEALAYNLDILKFRNKRCKQICWYKLENNTLNSVLDCDSNNTIMKKISWKGPKLCSAKGMPLLYILLHYLHFSWILCNLMKYDTAYPLKVVNRYNVEILLYLSNGVIFIYIACTEPKIWTCKIPGRFRPGYFSAKRKRVKGQGVDCHA